MKKQLLLISTFFLMFLFIPQTTYARDTSLSEQISWEIMKRVKSEIDKMLNEIPKKPYFIQNSSTRLGQITTMMGGVSDCVIRSVHGTEQAVIFFYDINLTDIDWIKNVPCAEKKIEIPEIHKSKAYFGSLSAQNLRIGIICRDKEFQDKIINLINRIDTDTIIKAKVSRYMEQLEKDRKEWKKINK